MQWRRLRPIWALIALLLASLIVTTIFYDRWRVTAFHEDHPLASLVANYLQPIQDVAIVVASQSGDNTTWMEALPEWSKFIYVTDDQSAVWRVPASKGREAMVYLTYIIDNYASLADVVIFSHSTRYQWHNDDPLYDGLAVLARISIPYVKSEGYVNLRCVWTLGCPDEIHPHADALLPAPGSDPDSGEAKAGAFYKAAFEHLLPGIPVPEVVGSTCCAQFAVAAHRIRERPREDYERYRDWLINTPLTDSLSGRILEYSWHIIFGKEAVHCPAASECYCKLFGLCNLDCEKIGECHVVYELPEYSVMPPGWPDFDWNGDSRNVTEMRQSFESSYRVTPTEERIQVDLTR